MHPDFDIRAYLVSSVDMPFFDEDAEDAAEQLNQLLHYIPDFADEDEALETLEEVVRLTLYRWIEEPELMQLDDDEMRQFIEHQFYEVRQQEEDTDD